MKERALADKPELKMVRYEIERLKIHWIGQHDATDPRLHFLDMGLCDKADALEEATSISANAA